MELDFPAPLELNFLLAIIVNGPDAALVYADWLEEGDRSDDAVLMSSTPWPRSEALQEAFALGGPREASLQQYHLTPLMGCATAWDSRLAAEIEIPMLEEIGINARPYLLQNGEWTVYLPDAGLYLVWEDRNAIELPVDALV